MTGDVTFTNLGQTQHWVFDAQDLGNGTAKGNVLDEYAGTTATSKVTKVTILSATTQSSPHRSSTPAPTRTSWSGTSSVHGPRRGRGLEGIRATGCATSA